MSNKFFLLLVIMLLFILGGCSDKVKVNSDTRQLFAVGYNETTVFIPNNFGNSNNFSGNTTFNTVFVKESDNITLNMTIGFVQIFCPPRINSDVFLTNSYDGNTLLETDLKNVCEILTKKIEVKE